MQRYLLWMCVLVPLACASRALKAPPTDGASNPPSPSDGSPSSEVVLPFDVSQPEAKDSAQELAQDLPLAVADLSGGVEAPQDMPRADRTSGNEPRMSDIADAVVLADLSLDLPADLAIQDSGSAADRALIAGQGEVRCGGAATCTSSTGPCCPATKNMSRTGLCGDCVTAVIVCDGSEDCAGGRICCSVESASAGFSGASCVAASECLPPSRVICHQSSDCPGTQTCGKPNPAPAALALPFPFGPSEWVVDFLVCQAP